jgi:hypothetical protein
MIRRRVRSLVAGFSLLSLLAAAALACLLGESRGGQGYVADASVLGTYVVARSMPRIRHSATSRDDVERIRRPVPEPVPPPPDDRAG